MRKKVLWVLGLVALALLVAACAPNASQSTLDPAGEPATKQRDLFAMVFWVAVVVFVVVQGGIIWIMVKFRHRPGQERMPTQTHGNTRLEIGWTILPTLVLAAVMVPTVAMIWDLARDPSPDALHVTVTGYQWWWGFEYTDEDMAVDYAEKQIELADVLVVPTGREIALSIEAGGGLIGDAEADPATADHQVIHSFWFPQLFGKQDAVPTHTELILFETDEPGTYTGQCAEFCGLQHTNMKARIVALEPAEWEAWVENQKLPPVESEDPLVAEGRDLFMNPLPDGRGSCTACHTVGDVGGISGPNLSRFADPTHECFAGCNWDTTDREALESWLRDPTIAKMGSKMPNYDLTEDEIDAIVAYLESLT